MQAADMTGRYKTLKEALVAFWQRLREKRREPLEVSRSAYGVLRAVSI